jgi:hypothetical protein
MGFNFCTDVVIVVVVVVAVLRSFYFLFLFIYFFFYDLHSITTMPQTFAVNVIKDPLTKYTVHAGQRSLFGCQSLILHVHNSRNVYNVIATTAGPLALPVFITVGFKRAVRTH